MEFTDLNLNQDCMINRITIPRSTIEEDDAGANGPAQTPWNQTGSPTRNSLHHVIGRDGRLPFVYFTETESVAGRNYSRDLIVNII
jgi:hypothetical protein